MYRAAISELGYDANVSSPEQLEEVTSKSLSRLCIPTNAPKFFVDRLEDAKATQRPIVIVFFAHWCGACLKLKNETLEHADVVKALGTAEVIYLDLDKYPAMGDAYGVATIPDVFFIAWSGRSVDRLQVFEPPDAFIARVRRVFGSALNRDGGDE